MFLDYLKDEYQFALYNVHYDLVKPEGGTELELNISDDLSSDIVDGTLHIIVTRTVSFIPAALYTVSVKYTLSIPFKEDVDPSALTIDWSKEFTEHENAYLSNIMSRASHIIAAITSSGGQPPIITPPVFMPNN
nr:MAG TPA: hypothetical protein [Caudoviricetes sp.]